MSRTVEAFNSGLVKELNIVKGNSIYSKFESRKVKIDSISPYIIPGRGSTHINGKCGSIKNVYACKDTKNKVVHRHSCGNRECPVCYKNACVGEASKIQSRIRAYDYSKRGNGSWWHWIISPPYTSYNEKTLNLLLILDFKQYIYTMFQEGVLIFHPYSLSIYNIDTGKWCGKNDKTLTEENKGSKKWEFKPHFHILSKTEHIPKYILNEHRKIVGLIKKKKHEFNIYHPELSCYRDIHHLLAYELSHAGYHSKKPSYVYFGDLHPRRFSTKKIIIEAPVMCTCPECCSRHYTVRGRMKSQKFKVLGKFLGISDKKIYKESDSIVIEDKDQTDYSTFFTGFDGKIYYLWYESFVGIKKEGRNYKSNVRIKCYGDLLDVCEQKYEIDVPIGMTIQEEVKFISLFYPHYVVEKYVPEYDIGIKLNDSIVEWKSNVKYNSLEEIQNIIDKYCKIRDIPQMELTEFIDNVFI